MAGLDFLKNRFPANHPDLADVAVQAFTGGNYRYFVYKWKFARGFSQWNWAAFFFGPLWFALRRNYFWAGLLSLGLLAGDFYFSANPYHITLTVEVLLFSGLFANKIYYRKFLKIQSGLKREKASAHSQALRLAQLGGRCWRPAFGLSLALVVVHLLLPSAFGVNLFATHVRRVEVQSFFWSLTDPEQGTRELALLREDYQLARWQGAFARSLAVNENSLKLALLKLGRDHPYTIALQSDLIENKLNAGAFRDVLPLTEELIKQYQLQFGPEHMFMAFMMNNLVANYLYQGLYDQAKSECFNALLILEKYSKNETHPVILTHLAAIYSNMGVIQQAYGQYDEAEKNDRDALQMSMQAEKGYSIYGCVYLERLGDLFLEQRKLDEAEEQFQQAKDIVGKSLGLGNPLASLVLLKLGEIRLYRNQLDAAERFFLQAQALNEKYFGPGHMATAESAYDLSRAALAAGKLHEAEKYIAQCLKITRSALGEENAHYARYLLQKAEVDMIKNNFSRAEGELKTALRVDTAIFGENNPRLLEPLEALNTLYVKSGNQTAQAVVAGRLRHLKSAGEGEIPLATKRLSI
jgi:predicted negative regulator of RcsB-dependent stress response